MLIKYRKKNITNEVIWSSGDQDKAVFDTNGLLNILSSTYGETISLFANIESISSYKEIIIKECLDIILYGIFQLQIG